MEFIGKEANVAISSSLPTKSWIFIQRKNHRHLSKLLSIRKPVFIIVIILLTSAYQFDGNNISFTTPYLTNKDIYALIFIVHSK